MLKVEVHVAKKEVEGSGRGRLWVVKWFQELCFTIEKDQIKNLAKHLNVFMFNHNNFITKHHKTDTWKLHNKYNNQASLLFEGYKQQSL